MQLLVDERWHLHLVIGKPLSAFRASQGDELSPLGALTWMREKHSVIHAFSRARGGDLAENSHNA